MRVFTIASGSSGNCVYVGSADTHLLVDAGVSCKRIIQGIEDAGVTAGEIDAVLVTHEHIDHVRSLGVLARRKGIPVYVNERTFRALKRDSRLGEIPEELVHIFNTGCDFRIGDIDVHSFSTSHDAADPVGYRFRNGARTFAVATDLGTYDGRISRELEGLDGVLLESNHDVRMLEAGPYPYPLKRRILSDSGHLSNEMAGRLLSSIVHDNLKFIMLGHLSQMNNYPELALETVSAELTFGENPYRASDFNINTAAPDAPGQIFEW